MFFLLAIPALAEAFITTAAVTIAAKGASDIYDAAQRPKDSDK